MRPQTLSVFLFCSLPIVSLTVGSGCGGGSASLPTPTATSSATNTPLATTTGSPSGTVTASPSPTGTINPTSTPTVTPTGTVVPTNTPTATPTSPIPTRFENDLAFSQSGDGQFGYGLYRSNADGSEQRTLVSSTSLERLSRGAAIRPNGLEVAFFSDVSGSSRSFLYVMNANGTNVRKVAVDVAIGATPSWSPNGVQLVAINRSSGRPFVVRPDGSNYSLLGAGSLPALKQPTFSPDGRAVYATTLSPGAALWKIQLDSQTATRVDTGDITEIQAPRFSPNGQNLAFVGYQSSTQRGMYVANADGSNPQLVANTTDAVRALWNPSNGLAFETLEGLFTINRNGTNRRFIIKGFDFDWR